MHIWIELYSTGIKSYSLTIKNWSLLKKMFFQREENKIQDAFASWYSVKEIPAKQNIG